MNFNDLVKTQNHFENTKIENGNTLKLICDSIKQNFKECETEEYQIDEIKSMYNEYWLIKFKNYISEDIKVYTDGRISIRMQGELTDKRWNELNSFVVKARELFDIKKEGN